MQQRLAALKTMAALLQEMRGAAERRDSDRLDELGSAYHLAYQQINALPLATADDPQAVEIAALSREILERQTELETLFQPWMAELKLIFRERRNEEVLASAYRQGS